MAELTYFEKLQDPRWQKLRLKAMEHYDFTCELCGDTEKTLHVHHKQYLKDHEPWDYFVGQLSVVCSDCHADEHDNGDNFKWVSSYLSIYDRRDLIFFIGSIAGLDYAGICYVSGLSDSSTYRELYELGLKAKEILNG